MAKSQQLVISKRLWLFPKMESHPCHIHGTCLGSGLYHQLEHNPRSSYPVQSESIYLRCPKWQWISTVRFKIHSEPIQFFQPWKPPLFWPVLWLGEYHLSFGQSYKRYPKFVLQEVGSICSCSWYFRWLPVSHLLDRTYLQHCNQLLTLHKFFYLWEDIAHNNFFQKKLLLCKTKTRHIQDILRTFQHNLKHWLDYKKTSNRYLVNLCWE